MPSPWLLENQLPLQSNGVGNTPDRRASREGRATIWGGTCSISHCDEGTPSSEILEAHVTASEKENFEAHWPDSLKLWPWERLERYNPILIWVSVDDVFGDQCRVGPLRYFLENNLLY